MDSIKSIIRSILVFLGHSYNKLTEETCFITEAVVNLFAPDPVVHLDTAIQAINYFKQHIRTDTFKDVFSQFLEVNILNQSFTVDGIPRYITSHVHICGHKGT